MNKIYQVRWNKSLNCWCVCSELGRKNTKKKSKTLLASILVLCPFVTIANDIDISKDEVIEFGSKDQELVNRITVTNNANEEINSPGSTPRFTIKSGGGLDISQGTVRINGPLDVLLQGTGFINVSNAGSELYADDLYNRLANSQRDGGFFNITDGGKVHVKGTTRLNYENGNISGEGSQLSTKTFFMGFNGYNGSNQFLSVNDCGEVNASERIGLGYANQGTKTTLVVSDRGKISAPEIQLSTNSELALGAREGEKAQAAGFIDTRKIEFVYTRSSDKQLTLNHTSDDANISADISSGSAGLGTIKVINGTTVLSGDNSGFSGKIELQKNGVLGFTQNLGTAVIYNDGILQLNTPDKMVFDNTVSGNGTISVGTGNVLLSGNNSAFKGNIQVESGATVTASEQKHLGSGLSVAGKLQLNSTKDWFLTNALSGSGILSVNTGNHQFSFRNGYSTAGFTGTLELQDTDFNLWGRNTDALANAGLSAGTGSSVFVGYGIQSISHLAFSGGTVVFGSAIPGNLQSDGMVHVSDQLDLTGTGAVKVDLSGEVENIPHNVDTGLSLMEQEDTNAEIKLVSTSAGATVTGDAGNLQLQDAHGHIISDAVQHEITQNGYYVATGTYDYRLTSGQNNDGLYVGYGLTQIDLEGQGQGALVLNAGGKTGSAAELSSRLTGSGDLALDTSKGQTVSLSGMNNDHTGLTDVRSGNLLMLNDNVLGNTSGLQLAAETALDMNGHSQTIGKLSGEVDSILHLNGGDLTIAEGGSFSGSLAGSGSLAINAGTFTVSGGIRPSLWPGGTNVILSQRFQPPVCPLLYRKPALQGVRKRQMQLIPLPHILACSQFTPAQQRQRFTYTGLWILAE